MTPPRPRPQPRRHATRALAPPLLLFVVCATTVSLVHPTLRLRTRSVRTTTRQTLSHLLPHFAARQQQQQQQQQDETTASHHYHRLQRPCHAPLALVGLARSPRRLAQFLRQFPASVPPPDACFHFATALQRPRRAARPTTATRPTQHPTSAASAYAAFRDVPRLVLHHATPTTAWWSRPRRPGHGHSTTTTATAAADDDDDDDDDHRTYENDDHPASTAALVAALLAATRPRNVSRVVRADDDALFFTARYGGGKDDVHRAAAATSLAQLLPSPPRLHARLSPPGGRHRRVRLHRGTSAHPGRSGAQKLFDAASVLHESPSSVAAFSAATSYAPPPPFRFESLPVAPGARVAAAAMAVLLGPRPLPRHVPFVAGRAATGASQSLFDGVVFTPRIAARPRARALLFDEDAPLPVARADAKAPFVVARSAFFTLFPMPADPRGRAVAAVAARAVLRWSGRGVIVVSPALDLLDGPAREEEEEGEEGDVEDGGGGWQKIANFVHDVLGSPPRRGTRVDLAAATRGVLLALARAGHLSDVQVESATRFLDGVMGARVVARGVRRRLADTAACVTGQMRSAPISGRALGASLEDATGGFIETFVVTARDERSAAQRLFGAVATTYSRERGYHAGWIEAARRTAVLHGTMATEQQLHNYLRQLADMADCLQLVQHEEARRGRRFSYLIRARPDTVLRRGVLRSLWGEAFVAHGTRQAFYAMNDRFFAGGREVMGRLLSCHDVFLWIVQTGRVYHRAAGDATHMMFKKEINSERFMARCAALKRVPLRGVDEMDAWRLAYSDGVARWREFAPK